MSGMSMQNVTRRVTARPTDRRPYRMPSMQRPIDPNPPIRGAVFILGAIAWDPEHGN
jgi:hypothetical protein